jgi:hypothetical protein
MTNTVSGTFEEVERRLAAISQEGWDELCRKLFKYDCGNPVRTEGKIPLKQNRVA